MARLSIAVLLAAVVCVCADFYLHQPRGSNDRLDEQNRNRDNANRLFDSQNNNKGGYNVNNLQYYAGSILQFEWTNQHSAGQQNAFTQITFQYMCDEGTGGQGIRDGQVTDTIPEDKGDMVKYGRHESMEFYGECATRQRNKGLFTADQTLNGNTAEFTRQNTNGDRFGYECPEERDYYPYWHPSPWKDIAVLTEDMSRCDYFQQQSQNVANKGHCTGTKPATGDNNDVTDGVYYNNQADCAAAGAGITWVEDSAYGLDAPVCLQAPWSRDNHLGNGLNGFANTFDWKVPVTKDKEDSSWTCVVRGRYNMSTNDYDPATTDSTSNGATKSPVTQDPTYDLSTGTKNADTGAPNLKLALNTDQYGRTFQDRSSTFIIKPRPADVSKDATIYNLNVKGQRGNIVENYPAVEYDFTPNNLVMAAGDYVHRQVSGSNTTPAGAGQGRESTDRTNIVEIDAQDKNRPRPLSTITMIPNPQSPEGYAMVKQWATLGQNDNEQDDAAPYQDFGIMQYNDPATYHYVSTRTNNFSNRSQKGVITVINSTGLSTGAIVGIVIGSVAGVALPTGAAVYGHKNPSSALGRGMSKIKGVFNRSPSIPSNYAMSS